MMPKTYPPGIQLLILLGLTLMFSVFAGYVFSAIYPEITDADLMNDPWAYLNINMISQVFIHILVFFSFLRFTQHQFKSLIFIRKLEFKKLLWIPFVLFISIFIISFLSQISTALFENLQFYSALEDEAEWQTKTAQLFTHHDSIRFVYTLFVVAILPAVGEELIYRGILLTKLQEATKNVHFSVFISAIIFAAMHSQPIQLLPIVSMGVLFGYIYVYTKNIWYSMILHFLFNAIQIVAFYFWPAIMA